MKRVFFLLLISLSTAGAWAQNISGRIVDENNNPLAYANVVLQKADSTYLAGTVSDGKGCFSLPKKSRARRIHISYVGYQSFCHELDRLDFGTVQMKANGRMLQEVVVKAENMTASADKSVIHPSELQLKVSHSSLNLLQNLNLPGLYVDAVEHKVSINGRQPVYMINGVIKTLHEFLTVDPRNIAGIEYEDSPSIRHIDRGAGGVINLILKQREQGGSFSGGVSGSPQTGFLDSDLYASYNWAKSEISVNYFNSWRDYTHRRTDKSESFISGSDTISRTFAGVDSPFGYLDQGVYVGYTYQGDENTMFNATFRNDFGRQHTAVNGNVAESLGSAPYFRDSKSAFRSYLPALDLFFKRRFRHGQFLEINLVGTLQDSDYKRDLEDNTGSGTNEISNRIDHSRKSLISEAVYRKDFKKASLSFGYQNMVSSSRNIYNDSSDKETLAENNNYIYGRLSGRLGRFSYDMGTGLKVFSVKNDDDSKRYVKNHSSLSVMYAAGSSFSLKLSSFYTPQLPSLSQLSRVTQISDNILKIKGNPDLKAVYTVGSTLFANYKKGNFNSNLTLGFQRTANTIYSDAERLEGNTFIAFPRNAAGDSRWHFENKCSYLGILNHINLFSTIGYNAYTSEGEHFRHRLNHFYWQLSGQVYWGEWTLSAYYVKPKKSLRAQTVELGENNSQITLQYQHKNLNVYAAMKYPFENGWKWSEENLSGTNPGKNSILIKDNRSMVLLGVTYSLDFGKGLKKLSKNLNNGDNTPSLLKVQE